MLSREYGSTITGFAGCNAFEIPVSKTSVNSKGTHLTTRFDSKTNKECSTDVKYDEKLDKVAKDVRHYDWKLVELDDGEKRPYRQWITFGFHNYLVKGNNGCALFEDPFAINTKTSTVTLFVLQSDTTK
ncbi:hypothetical protein [Myroides odoratimimus]|uniref:hypothetical protein n=1 Tax=Myroides odoratimimus TaxID=76832 RepID=UPI0025749221|nr:hypothetical protein [Myroides odoratimimus]